MNMKIAFLVVIAIVVSACGGSPARDMDDQKIEFVERITRFEDGVVYVTENDAEGNVYHINTRDHSLAHEEGPSVIPGHTSRFCLLNRVQDGNEQIAWVGLSWDEDNPQDYLTAGVWMVAPVSDEPISLRDADAVTMFTDGPEIDIDHPPNIATVRQCRLRGPGRAVCSATTTGRTTWSSSLTWAGRTTRRWPR